jgi:uncharacterized membrane protein
VCSRCFGKYLGIIIFTTLQVVLGLHIALPYWFIVAALCPLPGAVDWLTQAIAGRESTNWIRMMTGALWGISESLAFVAAVRMEFVKLGLLFVAFLTYIALISWLVKRAQAVESLLRPFEEFVAQRQEMK